jgi:hypothetical protein
MRERLYFHFQSDVFLVNIFQKVTLIHIISLSSLNQRARQQLATASSGLIHIISLSGLNQRDHRHLAIPLSTLNPHPTPTLLDHLQKCPLLLQPSQKAERRGEGRLECGGYNTHVQGGLIAGRQHISATDSHIPHP